MALDYFPEFKCLMDKCNYTCCYHWRIDIRKPDYMKIKNLRTSKDLKEKITYCFKRIKDDSSPAYARMVLNEEGYCAFLTEDRKCGLQQECGYTILPEVCKVFPRASNISPYTVEDYCSTGCEQTVNLLLERPQGLQLIETKDMKKNFNMNEQVLAYKIEKNPALQYYKEIQMLFMGILQNRKYTLSQRIILMGFAARDLDNVTNQQQALAFLQKSLSLLQYSDETKKQLEQMQNNLEAGRNLGLKPVLQQMILHKGKNEADRYFVKAIENICNNLDLEIQLKGTEEGETYYIHLNTKKYEEAVEHFNNLKYTGYFMENLMVNILFQIQFPLNWKREDMTVWNQYLQFCLQYNIFRVICTAYMSNTEEKKDLVHIVTLCSRILCHSEELKAALLKQWKENGLDTLAHIAYLICC